MLYNLLQQFPDLDGPWRVLQYPSFRIPAAALSALIIMLTLFPKFIEFLRRFQHGVSNVREDTPEQHQKKTGTPTMGGLFILIALVVSTLLWADLSNRFVWIALWVTIAFGLIGFIDDYGKIRKKNSDGLAGRKKLLYQILVLGAGVAILWETTAAGVPTFDTTISIPFVSTRFFNPDIGFWYIPFAFLVIMGTSHAVNLTDGLDGLAIGPTVVSASVFLVLSYVTGLVLTFRAGEVWVNFNVAEYLNLVHIEGSSELSVFCAAMVGAGIGFLWFNTFPASVFMGDVGSLALGGALGTVAVLTKNEILSAIIHGVFLMETLSVIAQVASFKLTGKRVFKMAPIHHHYELKGWAEPKIIVRFWIISIILALVGLVSLKLR